MRHLPSLIIGFILGGAVMCCLFVYSAQAPPVTPQLQPPTAITVTLYPWEGIGWAVCEPVVIPPDKLDHAFRLLTPEKYLQGGVNDFIYRIVAEAVITHGDGTRTHVLVRDFGVNPAVVSVDGKNYFVARNDPDVYAGAIELIRLVNEVTRPKKAEPPKP